METPPSASRRTSIRSLSHAHHSLDVVCLSHLRWDFVFQRPQHLLTRCARMHRVFFVEEPIHSDDPPRLEVAVRQQGVRVLVPRFPASLRAESAAAVQAQLLRGYFREHRISDFVLWYYTPMALAFTRHLKPRAIVYDCMDELSAFAGAPSCMREHELELL